MRGTLSAGMVAVVVASGAAGQVVDLDALSHCSTGPTSGGWVEVSLDAGVYLITPVGPPAGSYQAWNAWSSVSGCDPSGASCSSGWLHSYRVRNSAGDVIFGAGPTGVYATPELALANARPAHLRICESAVYRFGIVDSLCPDNQGGVSIRIEPAPCPADIDVSGELDFFDFLAFQDLFAAGNKQADFDCSGELDFFDFLAFQNLFAAGC